MQFNKTRFDDGEQRLVFAHVTGANVGNGRRKEVSFWSFFHIDGQRAPSRVGTFYASRAELLADAARYGAEWGF